MPPSLRYLQDRWEEPPEEWEGDDSDEESPEDQPNPVDEEADSEV